MNKTTASLIKGLLVLALTGVFTIYVVRDYQASRGDINHDGIVNIQDLSIIAKNFERGE